MKNKSISIIILLLISHMVTGEIIHLTHINAYSHDGKSLKKLSELYFDSESGMILDFEQLDQNKVRTIDGNGQVVLPGLHDAHGHILGYGLSKMLVDLRGFKSLDDTLNQTKSYVSENQDHPWVIGSGWNQVLWPEKAFPSRYDLDKISKDKPIWLERIDGHAGWANSKALEIAGINRETAKNDDLILKDSEGVPTGILIDNAMSKINRHVPAITKEMKTKAITLAMNDLAAAGLTFIHDAGIDQENYDIFEEMAKAKQFPVRVYAMLSSLDSGLTTMLKRGQLNIDHHFMVRSVKLVIDGALGSYGALMHKPYSDDPSKTGAYVQTPEQIETLLDEVIQADFQANVHAIGDKGNTEVVQLLSRPKMHSSKLRHRVEHAQILRLEDIIKFKDHDLIASMQPTHATSDMNMAEDRIGPQRIKGAYAWQKLFKAGVVVASGSDFPVELMNPFHGIHAAVTRQNHQNQPEGGWYGEEAMSVEQALQSFTINAAFAAHAEQFSGSLDVGKQADFIFIDQDIFTMDPQNIWKTKVIETWVAGKQVYQAK